ncbi:MAG: nucleotidyltransferase family protein [Methylocystis sp.]|nr:nucleotidyltransferase family protein [Methylocystis sp.]
MLQKIGAEWQGFSRPSGRPFRGRICAVDTQDIIGRLRENEAALRAQGVAHAALFGSRARGDNRPDSDIDIMVEIAPEAPVGVFEYVAITQYLADLFPNRVDVANRSKLKALVRPSAEREAVYAF